MDTQLDFFVNLERYFINYCSKKGIITIMFSTISVFDYDQTNQHISINHHLLRKELALEISTDPTLYTDFLAEKFLDVLAGFIKHTRLYSIDDCKTYLNRVTFGFDGSIDYFQISMALVANLSTVLITLESTTSMNKEYFKQFII